MFCRTQSRSDSPFDIPDINGFRKWGGGGRHFKCICVGKHMISGAIWNKYARVNFSQTNESAQVRRARILCGL